MIPVRVFRQPRYRHISFMCFSRDCLAAPHVPESRIERFISQCIYSPHLSVTPCEFVVCVIIIPVSCFLNTFSVLIPVCYSDSCISVSWCPAIPVSLVNCFPVGFLSVIV